jgi:hypothetical protein
MASLWKCDKFVSCLLSLVQDRVSHSSDDSNVLEFMEPGKNADGYWGGRDVVLHLRKVVPMLQKIHPNKQLLFIFDNSSTLARVLGRRCPQRLQLELTPTERYS